MIRWALGEEIERRQHRVFVTGEQVSIPVEDDSHRRVSRPSSILLRAGAGAGGDPERGRSVAEVVGAERLEAGGPDRRSPVPGPAGVGPQRPPSLPGNTKASGPGPEYSAMWAANRSATDDGMGTVRLPALVLGALNSSSPLTSTAVSITRAWRRRSSTRPRRSPASSPRRSPQ